MAKRTTQTGVRRNVENAVTARPSPETAKRQATRSEASQHDWQQTLGNQGFQRLLLGTGSSAPLLQRTCASCAQHDDDTPGIIQTKLTINEPGDVFEQEADRAADAVMSSGAAESGGADGSAPPGVQRSCACGGSCKDCQRKANVVQRTTFGKDAGEGTAPPIVHQTLRSPGHSLDPGTQSFMESRFGGDFSGVRVHTDARADESARAVNARAYTVGRHVVFSNGQYSPKSVSGRKLLAHELSHVVQQNAAGRDARASGAQPSGQSPALALQRACFPKGIGHPSCSETDPKHEFVDGLLFEFNINCDDLSAGTQEQLAGLAKALRPDSKISIHGYASTDGPKDFNEDLACARALKAKSILTDGGIPESSITNVINHGPTPGPAEKRRSVTLVVAGPTPKNDPSEARDVPATVDVKTTKSGEEPPSGPAKPPVVKVDQGTTVPKTPDKSTQQTTPSPPAHLVEFGGEANMKLKHQFIGARDPSLSTFCRNTEFEGQLNAKLKLEGFGVGDHLKLFYHEPQFSMSFFPAQCGKPSEEKVEVDVVNWEIFPKILELALKPGLTLSGTDLQPGASIEAEWKPWGKNTNILGHIKINGELEVKYENDPSGKKETTLTGTLGAGLEF
jgi:outer membrane protein OmpA-like peptidoglycan-associated protein